jgi:hypothetical protein
MDFFFLSTKIAVYGTYSSFNVFGILFPALCCRFVPYLHTEEGRRFARSKNT